MNKIIKVCPKCNVVRDSEYIYCQQCGRKLDSSKFKAGLYEIKLQIDTVAHLVVNDEFGGFDTNKANRKEFNYEDLPTAISIRLYQDEFGKFVALNAHIKMFEETILLVERQS